MQFLVPWSLVPALAGLFLALGWVARHFFYEPLPAPFQHAWPRRVGGRIARAFRGLLRRPTVKWLGLALLVAGAVSGLASQLAARLHDVSRVPPEGGARVSFPSAAEPLVPRPTAPPLPFIRDGEFDGAIDRDWARLEPRFARAVAELAARMERRGFPVVLVEGYRSPERQDALAQSGAGVTRARAFQSRHQFGEAADLAPVRDGRIVLSERDPWGWQAYQVLGEEAEAMGLVWGGRWSLRDYGHVEMADGSLSSAGAARRTHGIEG